MQSGIASTSQPLVTIGLPVYNTGPQLQEALAALQRQTWRNLDILISDNASSDSTFEICQRAAAGDGRIRLVRQRTNIGPVANFAYVRHNKRGDFFCWAAHDDLREPTYVEETLAALLADERAVMAHSWTVIERSDGSSFIDRAYDEGSLSDDPVERLHAAFRCTYNVSIYGLFRSSALDRLGPIDDWVEGDRYFLFDAILQGPIAIVPKVLFRYRMFRELDEYRKMFPFTGDHILERYRRYPNHLRRASLDAATKRRCNDALRSELLPVLDRRLTYLLSELLSQRGERVSRLRALARWAVQYPPAVRSRMFWGAVRIILGPSS
jgi:glycosyltransferase involved in cell wall biosynthesis